MNKKILVDILEALYDGAIVPESHAYLALGYDGDLDGWYRFLGAMRGQGIMWSGRGHVMQIGPAGREIVESIRAKRRGEPDPHRLDVTLRTPRTQTIKIALRPEYAEKSGAYEEIEAQVFGSWAAHGLSVTHVPTGRSVAHYLPSSHAALVLAHALDASGVRIPEDPSKTPKRTVAEIRAAIEVARTLLSEHGTLEVDVARVVRAMRKVR